MTDYKPIGKDKFEKIRQIYVESFPEKLQVITRYLKALSDQDDRSTIFIEFKNEVHKLAGSSGSHGFDEIYQLSRKIEKLLAELVDDNTQWDKCAEHFNQQVNTLITSLKGIMREYNIKLSLDNVNDEHASDHLAHRKLPIFIISEKEDELALLTDVLENRSFAVYAFKDLKKAQEASKEQVPAIIVLEIDEDLSMLAKGNIHAEFCSSSDIKPAIVIISRREDTDTRMKASLLGIDAFFASPINAHNFISTLDVLLAFRESKQGRVLLADEDQDRIDYIASVFKNENFESIAVNKATHIVDELVNFKPDLILLSLAQCKSEQGNVAKMIRSHEYYFNVPIICIVGKNDSHLKPNLLDLGVDDCITTDELSAGRLIALRQKIVRFRRANHLIIMDSLTGTLNRDAFVDRANEEISLAKRRGENICLAMIDIDHFKHINDANGHAVGDYVLRHLSDYLSNRLRRSDIVGRYGGDEFLVLLPDTDLNSAYLVLDMVRQNLINQTIRVRDSQVNVSISLGLVSARAADIRNVEMLIAEADKKLYEAKMSGRNKLISGVV